jgi:hypothetical protein
LNLASTSSNPTILNPNPGVGIILRGTDGAGNTGDLRIVPNNAAWADATETSYFQIQNSLNKNVSFVGGTFGADTINNRMQFNSSSTQITDFVYGSTPVPSAMFELDSSITTKPTFFLKAASGQTASLFNIASSSGASFASVLSNGNFDIGTTTNSQKLTVDGNMRLTGAYFDSTNSSGTDSMILQSTGTSTLWTPTVIKTPVDAATTAALPANTYANGASGVGATLTANANAALASQDGTALAVGDRLLVWFEGTASHNGIYKVTQLGSGVLPWILTRATDADTAVELNSSTRSNAGGILVQVLTGATYRRGNFTMIGTGAITMGTTALNFYRIGLPVGTSGQIVQYDTNGNATVNTMSGGASISNTGVVTLLKGIVQTVFAEVATDTGSLSAHQVFTDVPNLTVTLTTSGTSFVLIHFDASPETTNSASSVFFRILIDGVAKRSASGAEFQTAAITYKSAVLSAASHTIKVQYFNDQTTGNVLINPVTAPNSDHGSLLVEEVNP